MTRAQDTLKREARMAYELGRLRSSLRVLWFVLPITLVTLALCEIPSSGYLVFLALLATSILFCWRGQDYERGVYRGLFVGLAALAVPLSLHAAGLCCRQNIETIVCVLSGIVAGAVIVKMSFQDSELRKKFLYSASPITVLTASIGCLQFGVAAVLGLAAGVFILVGAAIAVARPRFA